MNQGLIVAEYVRVAGGPPRWQLLAALALLAAAIVVLVLAFRKPRD